MPEKTPAALVSTGKATGLFAYIVAAIDWFGAITLDRWTIVLAFIGAILYVIAMGYDIWRKRLLVKIAEQQLADHEAAND